MTMTDRVEKQTLLRAPLERVWKAISDAKEFGYWFGITFDGDFVEGTTLTGKIVPTKVDPEVAKAQEAHAGMAVTIRIDRIEPMRVFSYSWHPFAIDAAVDYSHEPMTQVVFELAQAEGGTLLTITESGFDRIPLARRADAFEANDEGWSFQLSLVEKYVTTNA
jgi:uncharacterized protein YndB with AHSA1/START domain